MENLKTLTKGRGQKISNEKIVEVKAHTRKSHDTNGSTFNLGASLPSTKESIMEVKHNIKMNLKLKILLRE